MYRVIALLIFLIVLNEEAYSFNWRKCKTFLNKDNSLTGAAAFASTTSFFSSIGECAMIGKADHDSKVFIAHNKDKMLEDFAKGRGEYAYAFASLYRCDRISQQHFVISVKENYFELLKLQDDDVFNFLREKVSKIESSGGSCKANPKGVT